MGREVDDEGYSGLYIIVVHTRPGTVHVLNLEDSSGSLEVMSVDDKVLAYVFLYYNIGYKVHVV